MRKIVIFLFSSILIVSACKKTKEDPSAPNTSEINTSNPNDVSANIKVSGSTRITGTPESSGDPKAPVLLAPTSDLVAINGKSIFISPELKSGEAAGYYLKVEGASDYFKMPVSDNYKIAFKGSKSLKIAASDNDIIVQLPENIKPGTFCFDYWVYDNGGNISNVVKQCVTVSAIGGSNAEFLVGDWLYEKGVDSLGIEWYNKADTNTVVDYFPCYSGDSILYNSSIFVIDNKMTFGSNGGVSFIEKYYASYIDSLDYLNCSFTKIEDTAEYKINGGWSYDANTKKFILLFDEKEYGDEEPYAEEYSVLNSSSNSLVIKSEIDKSVLYFVKK